MAKPPYLQLFMYSMTISISGLLHMMKADVGPELGCVIIRIVQSDGCGEEQPASCTEDVSV